MRYEAISFIRETDTASPFTLPTARDCVILRLKITHPSSTSTSSALKASIIFGSSTEKISSTKAGLSLSLSISFCTFSPSARLIEPMMIDFPAPVSPDSIFSPSENSTSHSSMSARFFTCRFCNIFSPSSPRHDDICYFLLQFSYNLIFM